MHLRTIHQYIFQSTHPSWGATVKSGHRHKEIAISIHAPIVGCDNDKWRKRSQSIYFNPRTHRGVRLNVNGSVSASGDFNPRTHRGVRLHRQSARLLMDSNFNPRTHRGVRQAKRVTKVTKGKISIHAPIVGCDGANKKTIKRVIDFNPRTHRGVRLAITENNQYIIRFQSTHPSWGATIIEKGTSSICTYFNPRTHRGVRR